jgi:hypothetical protein
MGDAREIPLFVWKTATLGLTQLWNWGSESKL